MFTADGVIDGAHRVNGEDIYKDGCRRVYRERDVM